MNCVLAIVAVVLPKKLSYKEAVAASSIANVAIAGLLTGDMVKAGQAIESDLFHERYRQELVREFCDYQESCQEKRCLCDLPFWCWAYCHGSS